MIISLFHGHTTIIKYQANMILKYLRISRVTPSYRLTEYGS